MHGRAVAGTKTPAIYNKINCMLTWKSTISSVTINVLLEATDTWAYSNDRGKINAAAVLALKEAFDTVNHEIP